MVRAAFVIFMLGTSAQAQAQAQCANQIPGTTCVVVPPSQIRPPPVQPGDILPRGEYNMLMNAPYYGLPRAQDGWVYFRVERDIVRVQLRTMQVLEIVTSDAARNGR